ncbi:MAG: protein-disulfide reductase DsbD family protein [Saprospiraceae bacterium]
MKKIALAFLSFFILFNSLNAQILKPVKWNWRAEKIDDNTYNLIFNAKIQETWSLYSQFIDDGGPVPTSFTFDPGSNYSLVGKTTESKNVETKFDKVFEMEIKKFHDYAEFVQKVKVSDKSKPITGYLSFMTCDDTRCLPPSDIDFSFDIAKWDEELQKSGSNNIKKKSEEPVKLETEKKVVEGNKTTSTAKDVEIKDGESTSNDESGSYDDFVEGGLLDAGSSESGNADPVGWDFEIEKISDDEFIIRFIAGIQKGWSIYSIYTEDNGPVPTEVYYEEKEGVVISEDAKETGHLKEGLDKMFGVNVKKFLHDQPYTIEQRVKVIDKTKPFKGTISYQACDDEKCVLLEENFAFDFDKGQAIEYVSQNVTVDSTMINPVTKHAFNKDRIEERMWI